MARGRLPQGGPYLRARAVAGCGDGGGVFRAHVERSIRATSPNEVAAIVDIADAYSRLAPLVGPLMLGVHQRWLEHVMAQAAVGEADAEDGNTRFPSAVDVTFLFCDLNNFTRFTSRHGDLAAARIAGEFAEVVRANAGTYGYLVKELGDGALLAYSEPIAAVRAWTDIVAAAREQSLPPLHGAIHRGRAVFRSGDYFGTAVNLVARLVGRAPRGELFATKAVVEATSDQFGWRARGARRVPGIRGTVALYSLLQPEVTRDR